MKFIQARHFQPGRRKPIRLLVVHDMEAPEGPETAERAAAYFAAKDTRLASAHYCLDNNSAVQCVRDEDTAYAAKGANADGLHFELAGHARQSAAEWVDSFGLPMLVQAGRLLAEKCRQYDIPVRKLTPAQVRAGDRGICGHGDVTKAFPPGSGHTDPGGQFPWPLLLDLIQRNSDPPAPPDEGDDDVTPADIEAVAQRVAELLRPTIKATEDRLHADHVVILRGTATGSHPNNLTSIGKAVGVKQ